MDERLTALFQGILLVHQAEWQLLEEHIQKTIHVFEINEREWYGRILRGYQLYVVGRTREAYNFIESTIWDQQSGKKAQTVKKQRMLPWRSIFRLLEASLLLDMGKLQKSRQLLNKILVTVSSRDFPFLVSLCRLNLAIIDLMTDNLDEAKQHLEVSLSLLNEPLIQFLKSEIFQLKSLIAFQEGRLSDCKELLATSVGTAETFRDKIAKLHVILTESQLHHEQADYDSAMLLVDEALRIARRYGLLKAQVDALFFKALLSHQAGRIDKSIRLLEDIEEIQRKTGYLMRVIDVKCLASKVYLSANQPQEALKQLDSVAAQFSGSLKVRVHLSIFFLSNNYHGLAKSTLEILLEQLQYVQFIDLYTQVLFLLAEVELNQYYEDEDERLIMRALVYLQHATQETIREKRKRITFFALLAQFYLELFSFDFNSSSRHLDDIGKLFADNIPLTLMRHVKQARTYFSFMKKQLNEKNEENKDESLFKESLRQMSLNQAMLILQELTHGPRAVDNLEEYDDKTSLILFVQKEVGPTAVLSDHGKIVESSRLMLMGVMFTSVVAQGSRYYEGLFGPLPYETDDTQALIYSALLPDSQSPDPRYRGKNYCLFVLTFPKSLAYYAVNRGKIEQVFDDFRKKVEDVSRIAAEDLRILKNEVLKYFSASWF